MAFISSAHLLDCTCTNFKLTGAHPEVCSSRLTLLSRPHAQVKLPSKAVMSYSTASPTKLAGSTLTIGPHKGVAPLTGSPLRVHYENNSPFLQATRLVREFEVSHWGNVYVEERYVLKHGGAKHVVSGSCQSS